MHQDDRYVRWFETLRNTDVPWWAARMPPWGKWFTPSRIGAFRCPTGFSTPPPPIWGNS